MSSSVWSSNVSVSILAPKSAASISASHCRIAQFRAIETALVDNELIILRGQDISSDELMAFGRRFGELTVHPFAPNEGKNAPELIKFQERREDATVRHRRLALR